MVFSWFILQYYIQFCRFCPEVYIGENGHLIQTCLGCKWRAKNQVHDWIDGSLKEILIPVEVFHLHNMFQDVIKHDQRFDFHCVPAVLELCCQARPNVYDENMYSNNCTSNIGKQDGVVVESLSPHDLKVVVKATLEAWERLRSGVQRLLLVYPTKVWNHCSKVHVGPSGHKARLCGRFKYESWRGAYLWKKAEVDNFVPPKVVWRRQPQDPQVLLDKGQDFYGHAPIVVELCTQAGAIVPTKYFCMMKIQGLPPPPWWGEYKLKKWQSSYSTGLFSLFIVELK